MSWQAHEFTVEHFIRVMGREAKTLMNVAQVAARYADRNGRNIRPGVETIADRIGRDVRTAQRTLRQLEDGWLRCVTRSKGKRPSVYEIIPMVDGLNPGTHAGVTEHGNPGTHAGEQREPTPASVSANPGIHDSQPRHSRPHTPAPTPGESEGSYINTSKRTHRTRGRARETGAAAPRVRVLDRDGDDGHRPDPDPEVIAGFDELAMIYPAGTGADTRAKALREYLAALRRGHLPSDIRDGARRYAAYTDAIDRTGTQYIAHLSNWLHEEKFLLPYDIPPSKAERRLQRNIEAMRSAKEEIFRRPEPPTSSNPELYSVAMQTIERRRREGNPVCMSDLAILTASSVDELIAAGVPPQ